MFPFFHQDITRKQATMDSLLREHKYILSFLSKAKVAKQEFDDLFAEIKGRIVVLERYDREIGTLRDEQIRYLKNEVSAVGRDVETQFHNLAVLRNHQNSIAANERRDLANELDAFQAESGARLTSLEKLIITVEAAVDVKVTGIRAVTDRLGADLGAQVAEQGRSLTELEDRVTHTMDGLKDELDGKVEEHEERVQSKVLGLETDFADAVRSIEELTRKTNVLRVDVVDPLVQQLDTNTEEFSSQIDHLGVQIEVTGDRVRKLEEADVTGRFMLDSGIKRIDATLTQLSEATDDLEVAQKLESERGDHLATQLEVLDVTVKKSTKKFKRELATHEEVAQGLESRVTLLEKSIEDLQKEVTSLKANNVTYRWGSTRTRGRSI